MSFSLPKQSFLAIAAVAWSDGRMGKDEAEGLLRAAREAGVDASGLAEIERATTSRIDLSSVGTDDLLPFDAALTYALASWLARLDGVVKPEEHASLMALAKLCGLDPKVRDTAAAAAFDVAMLKSGDRPAKYDFGALIDRLKVRLPSLAKT